MKTFLTLAVIGLSVSSAPAVHFDYRYTYSDGRYWKGTFSADVVPGEYFLQNLNQGSGYFYTADGQELADGYFGWWIDHGYYWHDDMIPANGSVVGMDIDFTHDNGGYGFDTMFAVGGGRAYTTYPTFLPDDIEFSQFSEPFRQHRWSLTPHFYTVPETISSGAAFGVCLLGIAGIKLRPGQRR